MKETVKSESFARELTVAARHASRSSSAVDDSGEHQPIDDGDDDVMKFDDEESEQKAIVKDTVEAWQLLARYIAAKMTVGYRAELKTQIEAGALCDLSTT